MTNHRAAKGQGLEQLFSDDSGQGEKQTSKNNKQTKNPTFRSCLRGPGLERAASLGTQPMPEPRVLKAEDLSHIRLSTHLHHHLCCCTWHLKPASLQADLQRAPSQRALISWGVRKHGLGQERGRIITACCSFHLLASTGKAAFSPTPVHNHGSH